MRRLLSIALPIIIYFAVEQIYGYFWGLVTGLLLSVVFSAYNAVKDKHIDWGSSLTDVALILAFGGGDVLSEKYMPDAAPAVTSGIMTAALAFLTTKRGMKTTSRMLDSIRPGIADNPYAMQLVRSSLKRMTCWGLIATAVFASVAGGENAEASDWVDKYLLLTILLACLATEVIVSRIAKAKYKDSEWVPLMSEDGRTVGGAPRPLVHNGSHWLHAVVHLHVINSSGSLLLQLRPKSKKIQPGKWDTAVGGHITLGEQLQDALRRETAEEIGLTNFEAKHTARYVWKCDVENEFVFVFTTRNDGPFTPQNIGEVEELRFWTPDELERALGSGLLTPNLEKELKDGLLEKLRDRHIQHT